MLHVKFVRYGNSNSDKNIHQYAEKAIDWFRSHSPLLFTTEWVFSAHAFTATSLNDEIANIAFAELKPISNITVVCYQAGTGFKGNLADTWPAQEMENYNTSVMVVPYDYPRLADGRTSWDPRYGEGFDNNFMAVIVHEMCHAIRFMGALASPPVDNQITDIHPTNDQLAARNPRVTSVEKALYWLSFITSLQFQLINQIPDFLPNIGNQWVVFKTRCQPPNAAILLGTTLAPINNNATYQFHPGDYAWQVSAPGYVTKSGIITLVDGAETELAINLDIG
jgi:hypothetical protein